MRSFVTPAALAAIIVSTSLTGAFAAGTQYPSQPPARMQPTHVASRTVMAPDTIAAPVYKPRLAHVMREIRAADQRIALNRRNGHLDLVEYRRLEGRSNAIRDNAERVARLYDGMIPMNKYQDLQRRIAMLNHSIHVYSTNRA